DFVGEGGGAGVLEIATRLGKNALPQLRRRQPGGLDIVQQRERDVSIWPNQDVRGHVLVSPEDDREDIAGADDIGRQHGGDCGCGGGPAARRARLWGGGGGLGVGERRPGRGGG